MNLPDLAPNVLAEMRHIEAHLDTMVRDCPQCGGQLRTELRQEWRPVTEAAAIYGIDPAMIRDDPTSVLDGFGQVACLVPYLTCMECGVTVDASRDEPGLIR